WPRARGRLVLERLEHGLALLDPRQQQDALLGLLQLGVAAFDEADPLLVAAQGLVQAELGVLEVADDLLQLRQGLLEGRAFGWGVVGHASPSPGSSVKPARRPPATVTGTAAGSGPPSGSTCSTRLTSWPRRRCVTRRSPGRACRASRS